VEFVEMAKSIIGHVILFTATGTGDADWGLTFQSGGFPMDIIG
jgi:hypothetical protein